MGTHNFLFRTYIKDTLETFNWKSLCNNLPRTAPLLSAIIKKTLETSRHNVSLILISMFWYHSLQEWCWGIVWSASNFSAICNYLLFFLLKRLPVCIIWLLCTCSYWGILFPSHKILYTKPVYACHIKVRYYLWMILESRW